MNLIFLVIIAECLFTIVWASILIGRKPSIISRNKEKIRQSQVIRQCGLSCLRRKEYSKASDFYSASLQLTEGIPSEKIQQDRLALYLTLSKCEFLKGNYNMTVALITRLLDEAPSIPVETFSLCDDSYLKTLHSTLSISFLRRSEALFYLGFPNEAQCDFERFLELNSSLPEYKDSIDTLSLFLSNTSPADTDSFDSLLDDICEQNTLKPLDKTDISKLLKAANNLNKQYNISPIPTLKTSFGAGSDFSMSSLESLLPLIQSAFGIQLSPRSFRILISIISVLGRVVFSILLVVRFVLKNRALLLVPIALYMIHLLRD